MLKVSLTSQTFMLSEACFQCVSVWEVFYISLGQNNINHTNANGAAALCPLASETFNVFQPRRFLNYPHSINYFIRHQLYSFISWGLEQTFLPFTACSWRRDLQILPLTAVSTSVYQKAPRRENHVNMKTLIPFLLIVYLLIFSYSF